MIRDPILKRLVAKAYLNGFGDLHLFTPEQMRLSLRAPKLNVERASYQDFSTNEAIQLRCYTPANIPATQSLPGVIYISATAFVVDRLDTSNDYCSLLANNLQMKIINVCHRLAPEHKFPRFLYDCLDSIKWVAKHADELQVDPDKLSIWGESSGGSIAATCAHILRDEELPLLKHQTLFYPMVDLVTPFPSKEEFHYGYMLDKPFIQWLDARGFQPEQDRSDPQASPLLAKRFDGLPPATIITAECDPLRDEGEAYVQKLQLADVPVYAKRFDGMIHCFMRFYPKVQATQAALAFACESLKESLAHN